MAPEYQSLVRDFFAKVRPIAAISHRQGQGNQRLFRLIIGAAMVSAAAAAPAAAGDVTTNVDFADVNLSPWNAGPAFTLQQVYNLGHSFYINLPCLNGNSVQAIADLFGVSLPVDADVTIRGSITEISIWAPEYEVSGGRVNVGNPAQATLSLATIPAVAQSGTGSRQRIS